MNTSDFDYDLPPASIAQRPAEPRDSSRLMVMRREPAPLEHRVFHQLPSLLEAGDLLVLNETRVIPARLPARKVTGGRAEILLLKRHSPRVWEAMVGGAKLGAGRKLLVGDSMEAEILEDLGDKRRMLRFSRSLSAELGQLGQMPLPPYIKTPLRSAEEYQTVYARDPGSAAAPTAGLHFTPALLENLRQKGIEIVTVTLHVGLDTFAPVMEEDPRQHAIHSEWCRLDEQAAAAINRARGRVIAVGTTSVRTLESAARQAAPGERVGAFEGPTDLYILPGFTFRAVDALITNFHLPRSTLLMMIAAFAGRERVLEAYAMALAEGYRFYSFGDAMLIS